MALPFYSIYSGSPQTGNHTYLLATRQKVDPSQPWTGIYLAADHDIPSFPNSSIDIATLFNQFVVHTYNILVFLYFAADTTVDVSTIGPALDQIDWQPGIGKDKGVIVWVAAPKTLTQPTIGAAPQLPFLLQGTGRQPRAPFAIAPGQQPLLSLNLDTPGGASLFITGGATVPLWASGGDDGLLLSGGGL